MAVLASAAIIWIFVVQPPRDLPMDCGPFFLVPLFRPDGLLHWYYQGKTHLTEFERFVLLAADQTLSVVRHFSTSDSCECRSYANFQIVQEEPSTYTPAQQRRG